MMNYTVVISKAPTGYIAICPSVPECHAQGSTYDECLANAKEALELCIEYMKEKGLPLPEEVGRETVAIAS